MAPDADIIAAARAGFMDAPCWRLSLRMGLDALRNGLDPLSFIRHLGTLGTLHAVRTHPGRVPALESLDAESCWLDFEILLQSDATRQAIADVFDFLQDDCTLEMEPESAAPPTSRDRRVSAQRCPTGEGRFILDGAVAPRMVPIRQTFNGLQRTVRDVGQALGKDVALQILGGETELDRALVDAIAEPLMHLVRNSLDHGLEAPDERSARGKPAHGQLCLQAYQEAGSVVLEISDDGRGLEVTDAPGRGVGMDVVRRQVAALHGQIHRTSLPGQGTTVQIRLPLTLSILSGFLTRVGRVRYVLPLDILDECIDTPPGLQSGPHRDSGCIDLRGQALPFLDLRACFGHGGERPAQQHLVVVRCHTGRAGLLVDQLLGELQALIKPLGPLFHHLPCLAGSTILGNGEVALALDVEALVRLHTDPSCTADATPWTTTPFRTFSTF